MHFADRLAVAVDHKKSCLLLGLDPKWSLLPTNLRTGVDDNNYYGQAEVYLQFCLQMMEELHDLVAGIKIQLAFFEALGEHGMAVIADILAAAKQHQLLVIIDGKRGDIGSTTAAYAQAYLGSGSWGGDALTVSPYLGVDELRPFLDICHDDAKGIFILWRTSNASAASIQGPISDQLALDISSLSQKHTSKSGWSSVGVVVGATNAILLSSCRRQLPKCWFLCPGVGAQQGKISDALVARQDKLGVLIPISRAVLYASSGNDYLAKAREVMQYFYQEQS